MTAETQAPEAPETDQGDTESGNEHSGMRFEQDAPGLAARLNGHAQMSLHHAHIEAQLPEFEEVATNLEEKLKDDTLDPKDRAETEFMLAEVHKAIARIQEGTAPMSQDSYAEDALDQRTSKEMRRGDS